MARNFVAKHAARFHRSRPFTDRRKALKAGKRKHKARFEDGPYFLP